MNDCYGPIVPLEEKDFLENIKWVRPKPSWEREEDCD